VVWHAWAPRSAALLAARRASSASGAAAAAALYAAPPPLADAAIMVSCGDEHLDPEAKPLVYSGPRSQSSKHVGAAAAAALDGLLPDALPGVEAATLRKLNRRVLALLFSVAMMCYIDRTNLAFASVSGAGARRGGGGRGGGARGWPGPVVRQKGATCQVRLQLRSGAVLRACARAEAVEGAGSRLAAWCAQHRIRSSALGALCPPQVSMTEDLGFNAQVRAGNRSSAARPKQKQRGRAVRRRAAQQQRRGLRRAGGRRRRLAPICGPAAASQPAQRRPAPTHPTPTPALTPPQVYGLGSGLFFVGYSLAMVPAQIMLLRVGAPRALGVIVTAWGATAMAFSCLSDQTQFYALRLMLGVFESGAFPAIWWAGRRAAGPRSGGGPEWRRAARCRLRPGPGMLVYAGRGSRGAGPDATPLPFAPWPASLKQPPGPRCLSPPRFYINSWYPPSYMTLCYSVVEAAVGAANCVGGWRLRQHKAGALEPWGPQ
jgi:hypothetical protein